MTFSLQSLHHLVLSIFWEALHRIEWTHWPAHPGSMHPPPLKDLPLDHPILPWYTHIGGTVYCLVGRTQLRKMISLTLKNDEERGVGFWGMTFWAHRGLQHDLSRREDCSLQIGILWTPQTTQWGRYSRWRDTVFDKYLLVSYWVTVLILLHGTQEWAN